MTKDQQAKLVQYGISIGVDVRPLVIDGQCAVAYGSFTTKEAYRAHIDLLAMTSISCAG